jgi:hypothetical protein
MRWTNINRNNTMNWWHNKSLVTKIMWQTNNNKSNKMNKQRHKPTLETMWQTNNIKNNAMNK